MASSSPPNTHTGHDRGVEVAVRRSPEPAVLRVPPQCGDLVALCLDLQAAARLLQVGRDGGDRVTSRPARTLPLRLDTDRAGYVDIPRSLGRRRMLMTEDVNTIRATNNAIFDDIFWVHLAYVTADDGIGRLRALLRADRHYTPILSGFEAIDQGRRVLEDATSSAEARRAADDLDLGGQPPAPRARAARRGATQLRSPLVRLRQARLDRGGHRVRGPRSAAGGRRTSPPSTCTRSHEGSRTLLRARGWPRITRFDDRWRWLVTSVVPRFRRFDADMRLIDASLRRILDEARHYASMPCVLPPSWSTQSPSPRAAAPTDRASRADGRAVLMGGVAAALVGREGAGDKGSSEVGPTHRCRLRACV